MNIFRVNINLLMYFVVNFMIIMVILVFFMVIAVNRRLFRYFGSYSGISVIPVILVSRRTDLTHSCQLRRMRQVSESSKRLHVLDGK